MKHLSLSPPPTLYGFLVKLKTRRFHLPASHAHPPNPLPSSALHLHRSLPLFLPPSHSCSPCFPLSSSTTPFSPLLLFPFFALLSFPVRHHFPYFLLSFTPYFLSFFPYLSLLSSPILSLLLSFYSNSPPFFLYPSILLSLVSFSPTLFPSFLPPPLVRPSLHSTPLLLC